MSSAQKNTIVREVAPKSIFEDMTKLVPATLDVNQGEFLVYDTGTFQVRKPTLETEGNVVLGIAKQTLVDGKPTSPYQGTAVDAAEGIPALVGPVYGVIARCVAKTGDVFQPGGLAYLDPATGGRGVSSAGTKSVGVYQGKNITATAGQEIEVLIGARYPGDVLQF
jgi:hypothetical protein